MQLRVSEWMKMKMKKASRMIFTTLLREPIFVKTFSHQLSVKLDYKEKKILSHFLLFIFLSLSVSINITVSSISFPFSSIPFHSLPFPSLPFPSLPFLRSLILLPLGLIWTVFALVSLFPSRVPFTFNHYVFRSYVFMCISSSFIFITFLHYPFFQLTFCLHCN